MGKENKIRKEGSKQASKEERKKEKEEKEEKEEKKAIKKTARINGLFQYWATTYSSTG
jgi:hypothetical protein